MCVQCNFSGPTPSKFGYHRSNNNNMKNNINFTFREEIPESSKYHQLFETTGWNKGYEAEKNELHKSVSNSWYTLCVYNNENELIGFGRLISDGVLYAFICDMIIDPDYQNQGIGGSILKKLIQHCKIEKIRVLWLFSAADKSNFYKKHGFGERPSNAPGMQLELNIKC
jgi:N-acetylglutamate synthase-like GNAT family acetyltransferase